MPLFAFQVLRATGQSVHQPRKPSKIVWKTASLLLPGTEWPFGAMEAGTQDVVPGPHLSTKYSYIPHSLKNFYLLMKAAAALTFTAVKSDKG
jgi:hypothetical protein